MRFKYSNFHLLLLLLFYDYGVECEESFLKSSYLSTSQNNLPTASTPHTSSLSFNSSSSSSSSSLLPFRKKNLPSKNECLGFIHHSLFYLTLDLLRLVKHNHLFFTLGMNALPFLQLATLLPSLSHPPNITSKTTLNLNTILNEKGIKSRSLFFLFFFSLQIIFQLNSHAITSSKNAIMCALLFLNYSLGEHLLSSLPSFSSSSSSHSSQMSTLSLLKGTSPLFSGAFVYILTSSKSGYPNILKILAQITLLCSSLLLLPSVHLPSDFLLQKKKSFGVKDEIKVANVPLLTPSNESRVDFLRNTLNYFVYSNSSSSINSSSPSLNIVTQNMTSMVHVVPVRRTSALKKRIRKKDFIPNSLGIKTVSSGYLKFLPRHSIIPLQRSYLLTVTALDAVNDDIVVNVMEGNLQIGIISFFMAEVSQ